LWYINNTQQETHTFELERVVSRDIVLFDMDGTLTEARKPFAPFLSSPLWSLGQIADIGIVTGSDMDYVSEQMSTLIQNHSIRYSLHILPCNGTKWYIPPEFSSHEHSIIHSAEMEREIGKDKYRKLLEILIKLQLEASEFDIPLSGHFISPRGSMINWSPSGRLASDKQRKRFKKFDKDFKFRTQMFSKLRTLLDSNDLQNVTVKLGGDTSFDIYPNGWDKTYALRHFSGRNVWFVGDRAHSPKGNDYEIFQACGPRSFHTTGPEETKEVIEKIEALIRENKNGIS
jgi:phosphomannomutase